MRRAVAVLVVVVLAVGTASAHQFVTFGDQPIRSDADSVVAIPLSFHKTSAATVRIDRRLAVDVVETDDDDRVVLQLDLDVLPDRPGDAVSAESGEARDPRVNESAAFGPGNYSLVVEPTTGVGDETRLLIEESTDSGTDGATEAPEDANPGVAAQSRDTPAPLVVIAALFGPVVPVAALAVAARLTG